MVRNYHGDAKWFPGTVLKKLGPVTCSVDIRDGWTVKRHIDQLRQNIYHSPKSASNQSDGYYYSYEPVTSVQDVNPVPQTSPRPLEEKQPYPQQQHCPPHRLIHENY